jgi:hypothetical protein
MLLNPPTSPASFLLPQRHNNSNSTIRNLHPLRLRPTPLAHPSFHRLITPPLELRHHNTIYTPPTTTVNLTLSAGIVTEDKVFNQTVVSLTLTHTETRSICPQSPPYHHNIPSRTIQHNNNKACNHPTSHKTINTYPPTAHKKPIPPQHPPQTISHSNPPPHPQP